eukprot:1698079-Rhodomonas_salina.2
MRRYFCSAGVSPGSSIARSSVPAQPVAYRSSIAHPSVPHTVPWCTAYARSVPDVCIAYARSVPDIA